MYMANCTINKPYGHVYHAYYCSFLVEQWFCQYNIHAHHLHAILSLCLPYILSYALVSCPDLISPEERVR